VRNLTEHGLQEGVSTRLLIYAGRLIKQGIPPRRACDVAIVSALSDESDMQRTLRELASTVFA